MLLKSRTHLDGPQSAEKSCQTVRFISALMEEGVPFVACDMPNATPFMLHVYAAVAEEEARAISRRTKAALAAAKARSVKLGGDRGYRPVAPPDGRLGGEAVRRVADHAAHRAMVVIEAIWADHGPGVSLHAVVRGLTERQVATPKGGAWTATSVRRVWARVDVEQHTGSSGYAPGRGKDRDHEVERKPRRRSPREVAV